MADLVAWAFARGGEWRSRLPRVQVLGGPVESAKPERPPFRKALGLTSRGHGPSRVQYATRGTVRQRPRAGVEEPDRTRFATYDNDPMSTTSAVQLITSREVPLGGPRAMMVRRTLPQRDRSLIGAWCFADHYGPAAGRMDVRPHPHSGLQTVSWLSRRGGAREDGNHQRIRPGEMNLMTSGRGIAHSEVSVAGSAPLHGVQLWVALPADDAAGPRGFAHLVTEEVALGDLDDAEVTGAGRVRVFLGELAGVRADVPAFTPLLGAELTLEPGATVELPVDAAFEHGVLLDAGALAMSGVALRPARTTRPCSRRANSPTCRPAATRCACPRSATSPRASSCSAAPRSRSRW